MTNWCRNSMKITGPIEEIARFRQTCIRVLHEGEQAQLDFNAIIPMRCVLVDDPDPDIRSPAGQLAAKAWFARREDREARYLEATGYRNPMDWASEHWGITKTKAYDFRVIADESDRYEFEFDTGSSPPVPVWEKMGEMFPALEFSLSGYESCMGFAFEGVIRQGKLEALNRSLEDGDDKPTGAA